LVNIYNLDF